MENLRIMAINKQQKDEIVDLLIQCGGEPNLVNQFDLMGIHVYKNGIIQDVLDEDYDNKSHKEITLPQLKDLVVLKRNSIEDATHEFQNKSKVYVSSDDICYSFSGGKWEMFTSGSSNVAIKPVEKKMKEFLVSHDNKWTLQLLDLDTEENSYRVAVPSGANICIDKYFFYKDCNTALTDQGWMDCDKSCLKTVESMIKTGGRIIWQRYKQPEELPLADGKKSLNDQYAEIEKVREKHSHYKKDISHLNVLDVYRVTELFKPHSCGAHIAKKALCSGQRGHKDLLTDIQDIIDTAERWKQMIQEDLNDNS